METQLTKLLNLSNPIMVAGMGHITGPDLAAAVSNAGGIGTIGAIPLDPEGLRTCIHDLKAKLNKGPGLSGYMPFGIDYLLPQVGGNARKTNKDYTGGQLANLIDVIIEEQVDLFVCAVGVPPQWVVDRLHGAGIKVMNMVGAKKHVKKALAVNVDIICAQGTEAGGHTGDVSTLVLVPQVADECREAGKICVAAGGLYDGRGIAACLALGAEGVWMGTRFLASPEANITTYNRNALIQSTSNDTRRTEIYSGRPMRVMKDPYNSEWAAKSEQLQNLLNEGKIPSVADYHEGKGPLVRTNNYAQPSKVRNGSWQDIRKNESPEAMFIFGQAAGGIDKIQSAEEIVEELLNGLKDTLSEMQRFKVISSM